MGRLNWNRPKKYNYEERKSPLELAADKWLGVTADDHRKKTEWALKPGKRLTASDVIARRKKAKP
jgi:hypothetical protein